MYDRHCLFLELKEDIDLLLRRVDRILLREMPPLTKEIGSKLSNAKILLHIATNLNKFTHTDRARYDPEKTIYLRICEMIEDAEELMDESPI